jgi:hypothetical protein
MTFVRIARLAAKRRASFIRGPATPTSRAADEAGISQLAWSSVGGKLNEAGISQPAWSSVGGKLKVGGKLTIRRSNNGERTREVLRKAIVHRAPDI